MRFLLMLCAMVVCGGAVQADNPGLGAYDAPAASGGGGFASPESAAAGGGPATPANDDKCRKPCYDTPQGCPKGPSCGYAQANPGYFSGIDSSCGLPAGTALTFGVIESRCNNGATAPNGKYKGMFQFSSTSCPGVDLRNAAAQATCMCDYTANTRRQFAAATNGQTPSAGMYYMVHQQGYCGIQLALGGQRRAVDVLAQCAKKAGGMSYALKAIGQNLPASYGYNVNTVTAAQFADIFLSKFKHIDGNSFTGDSACAAPGTDQAGGAPTGAAPGPTFAPDQLMEAVAASAGLTADGRQLSMAIVQSLLSDKFSEMFSPLTNPRYDENDPDYDPGQASDEEDDTPQVTISTHTDGTKTVRVEREGSSRSYTVGHGQQLWDCDGDYDVVNTASASNKSGCTLVTEVPAAK